MARTQGTIGVHRLRQPWKEALDAYFEPFLALLLFPEVHRRIDWSRVYEFLGPADEERVAPVEYELPAPR